jgi:alpha-galactosidase
MSIRSISALLSVLLAMVGVVAAQDISPTPPMGWNSWDAYGLTINEADYKANATELAKLRAQGWIYAVIDQGWYMRNPAGDKLQSRDFALDANGLLIPATNRFPSSAGGEGFKPLADWVHARGLKFGIHIVRGVPRQAAAANLPIAGSAFRTADAVDTADTCPWDDSNYGVRDTPAGQAYYDAMLALYARWGVDFLKVDCIADHPYKANEIRQITKAIEKTGRPIVLSLSPGPTQRSHAAEIRQFGQMWRISNDVWDGWKFPHKYPDDTFPTGVRDLFDLLPPWAGQGHDGRWPDADMLPLGMLAPHPGWGEGRRSRLTADEARTLLSLHAIARSPLILGANLTRLDDATRRLITNRDVIAVNQHSHDNHPVNPLPKGFEQVRVWVASGKGDERYLALFNLDDKPLVLEAPWNELGLDAGKYAVRDLWNGQQPGSSTRLKIDVPPHGSVLFALRPEP